MSGQFEEGILTAAFDAPGRLRPRPDIGLVIRNLARTRTRTRRACGGAGLAVLVLAGTAFASGLLGDDDPGRTSKIPPGAEPNPPQQGAPDPPAGPPSRGTGFELPEGGRAETGPTGLGQPFVVTGSTVGRCLAPRQNERCASDRVQLAVSSVRDLQVRRGASYTVVAFLNESDQISLKMLAGQRPNRLTLKVGDREKDMAVPSTLSVLPLLEGGTQAEVRRLVADLRPVSGLRAAGNPPAG